MERKIIKILHLRSSGGLYGAESVILTIAKELERKHCRNHIVSINSVRNPHSEMIDEAKRLGIKASSVDSMGPLDWEAIKELRKLIKKEQCDVLHFHDYKASVYGFLASWWLAPKRVVTNHLWDRMDWKLWFYQRLEGLLYNKFDRIVAVSERVKRDVRPFIVHKSKIEVITNGIDCAVFSEQRIKDKGLRMKESESNSSFIHHPSSLKGNLSSSDQCQCGNAILRRKFCLKDSDVVIGIIGRLAKQKGHEYLLKAMASLLAKDQGSRLKDEVKAEAKIENHNDSSFNDFSISDASSQIVSTSSVIPHPSSLKLLIVGDGILENSLKKLCKDLNLKYIDIREVPDPSSVIDSGFSVIFAGARTDMPDVYKVLDILAMPSLQEGLPMVLLEAMVAGVPVIATPVGQIPEIIKDGETGFLVQPASVEGLTSVFEQVIPGLRPDITAHGSWLMAHEQSAMSNEQIQNIINAARRLVEQQHSSTAMANKYLETYEWLAE